MRFRVVSFFVGRKLISLLTPSFLKKCRTSLDHRLPFWTNFFKASALKASYTFALCDFWTVYTDRILFSTNARTYERGGAFLHTCTKNVTFVASNAFSIFC